MDTREDRARLPDDALDRAWHVQGLFGVPGRTDYTPSQPSLCEPQFLPMRAKLLPSAYLRLTSSLLNNYPFWTPMKA